MFLDFREMVNLFFSLMSPPPLRATERHQQRVYKQWWIQVFQNRGEGRSRCDIIFRGLGFVSPSHIPCVLSDSRE